MNTPKLISQTKNALISSNPRWFSDNPSKAWGEKFFLIYIPSWILILVLSSLLGLKQAGEIGSLIRAVFIVLPLIIVPLLIRNESALGRRWYQTYWFKANLYIFIFSFFGNYFGSEYFFDVLGMVYNYPGTHWNFDSALVGSGQQHVPVVMYFLTQAYFITYHTTAVLVLRRIKTSRIPGIRWLFPVFIFVISYFWAWMETFIMANPKSQGGFYYQDLNRMLTYGSITYALYFITSFPIFFTLDEKSEDNWTLLRTIFAALSASMLTFFLLDFWTQLVGRIY